LQSVYFDPDCDQTNRTNSGPAREVFARAIDASRWVM